MKYITNCFTVPNHLDVALIMSAVKTKISEDEALTYIKMYHTPLFVEGEYGVTVLPRVRIRRDQVEFKETDSEPSAGDELLVCNRVGEDNSIRDFEYTLYTFPAEKYLVEIEYDDEEAFIVDDKGVTVGDTFHGESYRCKAMNRCRMLNIADTKIESTMVL